MSGHGQAIEQYHGRFAVWGPPGTGKTTFLSRQVQTIVERFGAFGGAGRSVLVCSLTNAAAKEIAGRDLPLERTMVGTLHAHGYRSIGSPEIAECHADEFNQVDPRFRLSAAKRGASQTDVEGLQEPGAVQDGVTQGDRFYERVQLFRARCVPRERWHEMDLAFDRSWEAWKRENEFVDFTDMIERAIDAEPPGNPRVVICDEAQDLSRLELRLLASWGEQAGCTMICGDPYQSLYIWRGADPSMFDTFHVEHARRRVLSQSWRIPLNVHRLAMGWVGRLSTFEPIKYRARARDGVVASLPASAGNWRSPEAIVDFGSRLTDEGMSVMYLAPCGYMLNPLVATLRKMGIPFANPWRPRAGSWNPIRSGGVREGIVSMLRRHPDFDPDGGRVTWGDLDRFLKIVRVDGLVNRGRKQTVTLRGSQDEWCDREITVEEMRDLFPPGSELLALIRLMDLGAPASDVIDLCAGIVRRCAAKGRDATAEYVLSIIERDRGIASLESRPKTFVGTIHSFKGAEADVVICFPDLSSSGTNEWETPQGRDSIIRLGYVAVTRARVAFLLAHPAVRSYHSVASSMPMTSMVKPFGIDEAIEKITDEYRHDHEAIPI